MGPPVYIWTHVSVRPFGLIIFSNNAHHSWVVFRGFSDYPSQQELVFIWVDTHMLARVCGPVRGYEYKPIPYQVG